MHWRGSATTGSSTIGPVVCACVYIMFLLVSVSGQKFPTHSLDACTYRVVHAAWILHGCRLWSRCLDGLEISSLYCTRDCGT